MSFLPPSLVALAQRLGLGRRTPHQLLQKARALRLPFQPLPPLQESIWWQADPPLHRLVELPRDALSGPVQEDKAAARAVLMHLVEQEQRSLDGVDLRQVDGLVGKDLHAPLYDGLEAYSATPECRAVRIISYNDFVRTLGQAVPGFPEAGRLQLRQAEWRGERLFWAGEPQHLPAFAAAVAYARRRGLEIVLPAELTCYRLSESGLAGMRRRYHMLAMPAQAWSDPAFMGLLLDQGMPYARLALLRRSGAPEFLLLPRRHPAANALGEGLRQAGAPDVSDFLAVLPTTVERVPGRA
ncbi:DUF6685 family protein [Azotobacter salinestris]|uniref:DUF6685 family protein n=1 Tax=Azotobacter salinestris TaxID=69964 RepID=UPI0032DE8FE9